jgi:hypothetical protein
MSGNAPRKCPHICQRRRGTQDRPCRRIIRRPASLWPERVRSGRGLLRLRLSTPPRDVEPGLGGRGDACTTGQPDGHSTAQPQRPGAFPFDLECRQHGSGTCTQARSSKGHPLQVCPACQSQSSLHRLGSGRPKVTIEASNDSPLGVRRPGNWDSRSEWARPQQPPHSASFKKARTASSSTEPAADTLDDSDVESPASSLKMPQF